MRNIANVERYSSVIINSFNPSKLRDVSLRLFWLTMTISTFFVQLHRTMMSEKQLELFVLIRCISLLSYLPLPSFILSVSGITSQNEIDTLEYKFWCPNIFEHFRNNRHVHSLAEISTYSLNETAHLLSIGSWKVMCQYAAGVVKYHFWYVFQSLDCKKIFF